MNDPQRPIREHLHWLLGGGDAHLPLDRAVANFPAELRGRTPARTPYSPWQLLEHLRICQWDILQFSVNADHVSPDFPAGYWPAEAAPAPAAWDQTIELIQSDLRAMQELVADPAADLLQPIPWGDGQTIFREALLIADHNAYHLGQLIVVRRLLGAWSDS